MTSKQNLRLKRSRCLCLLGLFAIPGAVAGHTQSAQIERAGESSGILAAGGPTGQYFNRFGLRYYREMYPMTDCFMPGPLCVVDGDDHAEDVYFPNPKLKWA